MLYCILMSVKMEGTEKVLWTLLFIIHILLYYYSSLESLKSGMPSEVDDGLMVRLFIFLLFLPWTFCKDFTEKNLLT